MRISVIIPALDEAGSIGRTVSCVNSGGAHEVIVADGGSTDGTPGIAEAAGASVVHSPPGRARQMNLGAHAATGEILFFLHADTAPPEDFASHIEELLARPGVAAGAFRLMIGSSRRSLRLIEALANFRSARMGIPYGDQGIFLFKNVFDNAGGFPELPIMEDYELMRRLKKIGRIAIADAAAVTSARRWEHTGVLRTTIINQIVIAGYHMGIRPETLRTLYSRGRGRPPLNH